MASGVVPSTSGMLEAPAGIVHPVDRVGNVCAALGVWVTVSVIATPETLIAVVLLLVKVPLNADAVAPGASAVIGALVWLTVMLLGPAELVVVADPVPAPVPVHHARAALPPPISATTTAVVTTILEDLRMMRS